MKTRIFYLIASIVLVFIGLALSFSGILGKLDDSEFESNYMIYSFLMFIWAEVITIKSEISKHDEDRH